MAGHGAPKAVRASRLHAGDVHRDLDDLLLVEDHAKRVLEDRLEERVRVRDLLASLLAADVRMHGVALDRSWPDDRHLDDEVVERLRPSAGQRLHLRPRLELGTAEGGIGKAAGWGRG